MKTMTGVLTHGLTMTFVLAAASLPLGRTAAADTFKLESPTFKAKGPIPEKDYANAFGCSGTSASPELKWSGAPAGTKSFAVTVHDEDAPTGSGFWHWVVYNIPAAVQGLPAGASATTLPPGAVQGNTDMGKPGYLGPCPPPGRKHRYLFTVYALKVDKLPVEPGATAAVVGFTLWMNQLGKATLIGTGGPRK
jgi:hypothetical protein